MKTAAIITALMAAAQVALKIAIVYAFIAAGLSIYKVTLSSCSSKLKIERIVKHGNLLCEESTFMR